jgi:lipoyl-dependent peroxiredoxin
MTIREVQARWNGNPKEGNGEVKLASGIGASYSYATRFENETGTNPEELLGAALASCFAMALSARLTREKRQVERIEIIARVHLDSNKGEHRVTRIELDASGLVEGIDDRAFAEHANAVRSTCPIARALGGVEIVVVRATLAHQPSKATTKAPAPSESNV